MEVHVRALHHVDGDLVRQKSRHREHRGGLRQHEHQVQNAEKAEMARHGDHEEDAVPALKCSRRAAGLPEPQEVVLHLVQGLGRHAVLVRDLPVAERRLEGDEVRVAHLDVDHGAAFAIRRAVPVGGVVQRRHAGQLHELLDGKDVPVRDRVDPIRSVVVRHGLAAAVGRQAAAAAAADLPPLELLAGRLPEVAALVEALDGSPLHDAEARSIAVQEPLQVLLPLPHAPEVAIQVIAENAIVVAAQGVPVVGVRDEQGVSFDVRHIMILAIGLHPLIPARVAVRLARAAPLRLVRGGDARRDHHVAADDAVRQQRYPVSEGAWPRVAHLGLQTAGVLAAIRELLHGGEVALAVGVPRVAPAHRRLADHHLRGARDVPLLELVVAIQNLVAKDEDDDEQDEAVVHPSEPVVFDVDDLQRLVRQQGVGSWAAQGVPASVAHGRSRCEDAITISDEAHERQPYRAQA
mmetsp:Transcript_46444/g.140922  ORF Transcript_46444/g.140922 Transcript_46444/m.140922 type:complete len:464 (-) Transcript_46444:3-1394(-)